MGISSLLESGYEITNTKLDKKVDIYLGWGKKITANYKCKKA